MVQCVEYGKYLGYWFR